MWTRLSDSRLAVRTSTSENFPSRPTAVRRTYVTYDETSLSCSPHPPHVPISPWQTVLVNPSKLNFKKLGWVKKLEYSMFSSMSERCNHYQDLNTVKVPTSIRNEKSIKNMSKSSSNGCSHFYGIPPTPQGRLRHIAIQQAKSLGGGALLLPYSSS